MRHFHRSPRRFVAVLMSAIIAATAGTLVLTQKSASALSFQCTDYTDVLCMWETKDYGSLGGRIFRVNIKSHVYNACVKPTSGTPYALWMNNSASALMLRTADTRNYITIANHTYYVRVRVYNASNCTGEVWTFQSNGVKIAPNLYNYIWRPSGTRLDNKISSYKLDLITRT